MKLKHLIEKKVDTETGWANLNPDGSMVLNNSGYKQRLSPEEVHAVWSGKRRLPGQGLTNTTKARFDGEYWDFGEELHVIPPKEEFAPAKQGNEKLKVGMVIQFKGERKGEIVQGIIFDISGRYIYVKDSSGDNWELTSNEVTQIVKK